MPQALCAGHWRTNSPFGGEDFDAVAFAVADDYEVVIEDGDVVREVELSVVGSGFSPGHDVVALGIHAVDAWSFRSRRR